MFLLLAQFTERGWSVTIANDFTAIPITGPNAKIVVLRSDNHDELERTGGQLLLHIARTANAKPTLFGRELVLAAVDSFMRLPATITPATIY